MCPVYSLHIVVCSKKNMYFIYQILYIFYLIYFTDLSVSATVRHPLIFFVTFAINQHQGFVSSVTSPSANQQPVIHKFECHSFKSIADKGTDRL